MLGGLRRSLCRYRRVRLGTQKPGPEVGSTPPPPLPVKLRGRRGRRGLLGCGADYVTRGEWAAAAAGSGESEAGPDVSRGARASERRVGVPAGPKGLGIMDCCRGSQPRRRDEPAGGRGGAGRGLQ